jgi:hypothetical protein
MLVTDLNRKVNYKAEKRHLPPMRMIQNHFEIHAQLIDILKIMSHNLSNRVVPEFDSIFDQYI